MATMTIISSTIVNARRRLRRSGNAWGLGTVGLPGPIDTDGYLLEQT